MSMLYAQVKFAKGERIKKGEPKNQMFYFCFSTTIVYICIEQSVTYYKTMYRKETNALSNK